MAREARFPNFVKGASALGVERLLKVASDAKIAVDKARVATPDALARAILARLEHANELWRYIDERDLETMGRAYGLDEASWKPKLKPGEIAKLADYERPSYAKDVIALFALEQEARDVPNPLVKTKSASYAGDWPEFASLAKWKACSATSRQQLAAELVRALGTSFEGDSPTGAHGLLRVRDKATALSYVIVVGGTFTMGLTPAAAADLDKRVKKHGEEAREHANELKKRCRPVRKVAIAPFLIAETPVMASHLDKLSATADTSNVHGVARFDAEAVAALMSRSARRLPSEAEWEYVARAGGSRDWLFDKEDPNKYAKRLLGKTSLDADDQPFGVRGLGWGDWIADGQHDTYKEAPTTGVAWQPRKRPTVVRGGAFTLYPWEVGGEFLLLHGAAREFDPAGAYCVHLAADLPRRTK